MAPGCRTLVSEGEVDPESVPVVAKTINTTTPIIIELRNIVAHEIFVPAMPTYSLSCVYEILLSDVAGTFGSTCSFELVQGLSVSAIVVSQL